MAERAPDARALMLRTPRSAGAEGFRSLRTALQFLEPAKTRSLLITSVGPGEGKSTCACNLAVALAQVGKRVLLVDADLRRPSLHLIFGAGRRIGLSSLLAGRDEGEVIVASEVPGLSLLPAGVVPPNPAELLESPRLDRHLEQWCGVYDHVIFDSPPVLAVTDPVVVARRTTGVLLVVRMAITRDRPLQRAVELLRAGGAAVLGTIVNDMTSSAGADYGYGYRYQYGEG